MTYRKYDERIRRMVVEERTRNPSKSYEVLAVEFDVKSAETVRYWIQRFQAIGERSLSDKRGRVKRSVRRENTLKNMSTSS